MELHDLPVKTEQQKSEQLLILVKEILEVTNKSNHDLSVNALVMALIAMTDVNFVMNHLFNVHS